MVEVQTTASAADTRSAASRVGVDLQDVYLGKNFTQVTLPAGDAQRLCKALTEDGHKLNLRGSRSPS
jgi:hypothetical protein